MKAQQVLTGGREVLSFVPGVVHNNGLPAMMVQRLQALADYMRAQSDGGNEDGHLKLYLTDIAYMQQHQAEMLRRLTD